MVNGFVEYVSARLECTYMQIFHTKTKGHALIKKLYRLFEGRALLAPPTFLLSTKLLSFSSHPGNELFVIHCCILVGRCRCLLLRYYVRTQVVTMTRHETITCITFTAAGLLALTTIFPLSAYSLYSVLLYSNNTHTQNKKRKYAVRIY